MSDRKSIRQSIVEILKAKVPSVSSRVYNSRSTALWEGDDELPALNVVSLEETAGERFKQGFSRTWRRALNITIEAAVRSGDEETIANDLDTLCAAVESALNSDPTVNKTCEDIEYESTGTVITDAGKGIFGAAEIRFKLVFIG